MIQIQRRSRIDKLIFTIIYDRTSPIYPFPTHNSPEHGIYGTEQRPANEASPHNYCRFQYSITGPVTDRTDAQYEL